MGVTDVFDHDALLSRGFVPGRRLALDIAEHALKAVDPYRAVLSRLSVEAGRLHVDGDVYDLDSFQHIYVVGGGKACYHQALAVEELLGDRITDGFVSVRVGQLGPFVARHGALHRIRVKESAHPVPDETSLQAGEEILAIAQKVRPRDLVLCLMSGGTSAQVIAPVPGVSVEDKATVNRLLVTSGAEVTEIMTVRRHLSRIKGGQLALRLYPATAITLTVSDEKTDSIVWNTDWMSPNGTSPADAIAILERYELWERMPESVRDCLDTASRRGMPEEVPADAMMKRYMVVRTRDIFEAAVERSRELGLTPLPLTTLLSGESREVGRALASIAREVLLSGHPVAAPCALIATGETGVRLRREPIGEGGANQELAAGACVDLAPDAPVAVLALDTDGSDGPTEIAGALTDGTTLQRARDAGVNLYRALNDHDISRALRASGDAVVTGPTGTNVNDIVVIVVLSQPAAL